MRKAYAFALVMVLAAIAVGCGGGGSETAEKEPLYPEVKGPSREFLVAGEDNVVQTFGREATKEEREEVSDLIEAWIRVNAAGEWAKACNYLSKKTQAYLVRSGTYISQSKVKGCGKGLALVTTQGSAGPARIDNLDGPIDSLRLNEGLGYAQYHGNDGKDWVVPLMREDGVWKITKSHPIERFE